MKFKTKKEALDSITERTRKTRGVEYPLFEVYLGTNVITGRQERLAASTKARLKEMVDDFYRERERLGDMSTALSIEQVVDARQAIKTLSDAMIDISLTECAKREVARTYTTARFDKTVGEAYDDFIESKEDSNSELEMKKTESTTGNWVTKIGRNTKLATITTKDIAEYLKTNYGSMRPKTYNAHLSYIRTFLNWCSSKAQGFIPENPAVGITQKPVQWEEPEFMSTETCLRLLGVLWNARNDRPDCLALAVNGLMMGIRREESLRMATDPSAITVNLDDETVRVSKPKGFTKGIMPRAFQMPQMAVSWAKAFDYANGVSRITDRTTDAIKELATESGLVIPKNGFRHTFITKHVAAYGEPDKTQAMVGTSAQMRANNYCGLDSRQEGVAFFAIRPPQS